MKRLNGGDGGGGFRETNGGTGHGGRTIKGL